MNTLDTTIFDLSDRVSSMRMRIERKDFSDIEISFIKNFCIIVSKRLHSHMFKTEVAHNAARECVHNVNRIWELLNT